MKLVALKKLRYPRSVDGKEYQPGDPFGALSERDFKILKLAGLAADPPVETAKQVRQSDLPLSPAEAQGGDVTESTPVAKADVGTSLKRHYRRRDMTAEE